MLAAVAVPDLPRRAALPLVVGAWTNANAFGLLAFRPGAEHHPVFRAAVAGSFATTSWGFTALAVHAARVRRAGPTR